MPHSSRAVQLSFLLTSLAAAVFAPSAQAQSGYMFNSPTVTFSVRLGAGAPAANDDLFNFFTSNLTLERGDFRGGAVAADMFVRAAPRVDIGVGYTYDRSNNHSEFRDWDYGPPDNRPIEQTTRLRRSTITLGLRAYPLDRGRGIGHHAWVPKSLTPYVTAGGGWMFYDLVQQGEFVRQSDLNIITGYLTSNEHATTWYAGGGAQWWIAPHVGVMGEARYDWAKAPLDTDFASYNKIDLRGFQFTTGLTVRL